MNISTIIRTSSLLATILITSISAMGQINLKVGFNLGYTDLEKTDAIFERYESNNPDIVKPYSQFRVLNGIVLGGRYMVGNFGFDFELANKSSKIQAEGIPAMGGSISDNEWKLSMTDYSIGLENYIKNFAYGATIGYQKLTYKADVDNASDKQVIYSENNLSSKFFISLEAPSGTMSFAIRPYVSIPWGEFNVNNVDKELNVGSTLPASDFNESPIVYGVSFVIYNGPQR